MKTKSQLMEMPNYLSHHATIVRKLTKAEINLLFLYAVTCSMDGLQLLGVSISNYFLLGILLVKLIDSFPKIKIYHDNCAQAMVMLFAISIILSLFCSIGYLPSSWRMNSISCSVKYILAFIVLFLSYSKEDLLYLREHFFKGLYIGALIQMFWGFAQIILYYLFQFKLNTFVFQELLGISGYNWDSYITGGILRMKGIGWEPANFALVMIMGYILSNSYKKGLTVKIMFLVALALSTSRSGYVSIMVVLFVQFTTYLTLKKEKRTSYNQKQIFTFVVIFFVASLIIIYFHDFIIYRLNVIIKTMATVFDTTDSTASNSIHISYYSDLFNILKQNGLLRSIFGCGYYAAGYPYSLYNEILIKRLSMVGWNPETDFVTLIVGNGFLGFGIYYYNAFRAFLRHKSDEYGLMVIAVISLGITYLSIRGTWSMMIIFFCMIDVRQKYKISSKGIRRM